MILMKECKNVFESTKDLFHKEYRKGRRMDIAKAFVKAFRKKDVSIIACYMTNPIRYQHNWDEIYRLDKEILLKQLSDEMMDWYVWGKVMATAVSFHRKRVYWEADVVVRTANGVIKIYLYLFLGCVYKIWIRDINNIE